MLTKHLSVVQEILEAIGNRANYYSPKTAKDGTSTARNIKIGLTRRVKFWLLAIKNTIRSVTESCWRITKADLVSDCS